MCLGSSWVAVTPYDTEEIETGSNFLNWIKPKVRKGVYLFYIACLSCSSYHCHQHPSSFRSPIRSVAIHCVCVLVPHSRLEVFFTKLLAVSEVCQLLPIQLLITLSCEAQIRNGSFALIIILRINSHTPATNYQLIVKVFQFSLLHINFYICITYGKVHSHSEFSLTPAPPEYVPYLYMKLLN